VAGAHLAARSARRGAYGGSIVLAAIMLKLGAYGFLRFSLPIVPDASHALSGFIIVRR